MRCRDALDVLDALEDGRLTTLDPATAEAFARSGWIAPAPGGRPADLAKLREEAAALQARLRQPTLDTTERARVQAKLADVRRRLFDAAEATAEHATVDVAGVPYALAWRGRELLDELRPRVHRVADADVEDFLAELDALRIVLRALARRASDVAGRLVADVPQPAIARLAATGLAGLGDDELPAAERRWVEAWRVLLPLAGDEVGAACAEATALGGWGVGDLVREATARHGRADATTLPVTCVELATGATATAPVAGLGPLGSALLRLGAGDAEAAAAVAPRLDDRHRHHAALVQLAGEAGVARYAALVDGLRRVVPTEAEGLAALLVLLDAPADEVLDDLRLAAECAAAERLGAGGFESLSLGAKLLLVAATEGGSALLPSPSPATDAARAALRLPVPPRPLFRALAPIHVELAHAQVATWLASHPGHRSSYLG